MKTHYVVAILVTLSLVACGKSENKSITIKDPKTGEKVDVNVSNAENGTITMKTDKGSLVINSGENATVPQGVDVYPGAKIKSSMSGMGMGNGAAGSGSLVSMTTKDDPATVMAFYKSKFIARGLKIDMETTTPAGGMITAGGQNSTPGAMVTVAKSEGETTVSVMMGK